MRLAYSQRDGGRNITLLRTHWEIGDLDTGRGVAIAFGDDESLAARLVEFFNGHVELRARLAAVEAERDRLRGACESARDHAASYANYLREFHWASMAEEFDERVAAINAALASPADDAGKVAREPEGGRDE